ncbi:hypothetical protein F5Y14DRAFT_417555 [Nemania sp. NC0429]|nr:hypothetical protein F5Y14DRAFT_417555 [Nemania sp. NC0429]
MFVMTYSYNRTIYPTPTTANYGPLTTTFTPAPSCVNATNAVKFGWIDGAAPSFFLRGYPTCSIGPYADACFPSASRWNSDNSDVYKTVTPTIHFYSPGVYCPESWTTVGEIVRLEPNSTNATDSLRVTGSGSITTITEYQHLLTAPSNTLVVCCPEDFTVDRVGGCYSPVYSTPGVTFTDPDRDLSGIAACFYPTPTEDVTALSRTTTSYPDDGDVWITQFVSVTEVVQITPAITVIASPVPFTYVPAVLLVHAPSDLANLPPSAGSLGADARLSAYTLLSVWLLLLSAVLVFG